LLRRNALPISLGHDLNSRMLKVLEWTGFVYAIGNLVFIITLRSDVENSSVFDVVSQPTVFSTILLGLLHLIFPADYLNFQFLNPQRENNQDKPYDEARSQFPTDYDIENPVTCRDGLRTWIDFIKSKKESGAALMKSSQKKGAFNILKSTNLKGMVNQSQKLSESVELKKENDLMFLQGYASKVFKGGVNLSKQKFEKEKAVPLEEIFEVTEDDLLFFEGNGLRKDSFSIKDHRSGSMN